MQRGFNQAYEMAEILARKKKCTYAQLVKRIRKTEYQSELPVEQRTKNVQHAFRLTAGAHKYTGKHLVLIDDLMTTGSTIKYIARELLKLNPASLVVLVACRAPFTPK